MAPALGSSSSRTRRGVPSARIYSVVNEHGGDLPPHLYSWELFFDLSQFFCDLLQKIYTPPHIRFLELFLIFHGIFFKKLKIIYPLTSLLGTFFRFYKNFLRLFTKNSQSPSYKVLGTFFEFEPKILRKILKKIFIPSLIEMLTFFEFEPKIFVYF